MTVYGESLGVSYQVLQTPLNQEDSYFQPVYPPQTTADRVNQRMMLILAVVLVLVATAVLTVTIPRLLTQDNAEQAVETVEVVDEASVAGETAVSPPAAAIVESGISPVFSPQIQHWGPQIVAWSAQYGLDPDIVATIMQIESCGDPQAASGAGAQGLFQVMPFHFAAGETMLDPDTNAARGLAYYAERLQQTNGDIFQAFAGYNGGHVAAAGNWNTWANETQRYYTWSKGIYEDAKSGSETSATLQQWMQAGGASLCQQASNRLNLN
jgi:hypothetical protein